MQVIRRLAITLLAAVLAGSLFGLAWSHALSETVRDKDVVKSWLDEGGLYDELGDTVAEQIADQTNENVAAAVENEQVRRVVQDAIGADLLQSSVEKLVDGVYYWLEHGVTPESFSVDLSQAKGQIATGVGNVAEQRAGSLPACTPAQTRALTVSFNIFTTPCLPPQISPAQAGQEITSQISTAFDENAGKIDGDQLLEGQSGEPLPRELRDAYQASQWLPFVFGFVAIASTGGIVWLSSRRRAGVQRVGGVVLGTGIAVGLSAFFLSNGPGLIRSYLEKSDTSQAGVGVAVKVAEAAGQDFSRMLWIYAVLYLVAAVATLLFAKFYKRPPTSEQDSTSLPKDTDKPATTASDTQKKV